MCVGSRSIGMYGQISCASMVLLSCKSPSASNCSTSIQNILHTRIVLSAKENLKLLPSISPLPRLLPYPLLGQGRGLLFFKPSHLGFRRAPSTNTIGFFAAEGRLSLLAEKYFHAMPERLDER